MHLHSILFSQINNFSLRGIADDDCKSESFDGSDKYRNDLIQTDCTTANVNAKFCFRQLCQCNDSHRQVINGTNRWDCESAMTKQELTVSMTNPIVFE